MIYIYTQKRLCPNWKSKYKKMSSKCLLDYFVLYLHIAKLSIKAITWWGDQGKEYVHTKPV